MNFIVMISSISSQLAYNEADLKRDQELKEGLVTSALFYFSSWSTERIHEIFLLYVKVHV